MASSVTVAGQISWSSLLVQFVIMAILYYLYMLAGFSAPFLPMAITYSFLSLTLRNLLAKKHRQGMKLVNQKRFTEAIPYFQKSYDHLTKNAWVDKYRFVTLLSAVKMSYKEMDLCNIAFCYGQAGNKEEAIRYYNKVLAENPGNEIAVTGLKMVSL